MGKRLTWTISIPKSDQELKRCNCQNQQNQRAFYSDLITRRTWSTTDSSSLLSDKSELFDKNGRISFKIRILCQFWLKLDDAKLMWLLPKPAAPHLVPSFPYECLLNWNTWCGHCIVSWPTSTKWQAVNQNGAWAVDSILWREKKRRWGISAFSSSQAFPNFRLIW